MPQLTDVCERILDSRTGSGWASGRIVIQHERAKTFRRSVYSSGETCRSRSYDENIPRNSLTHILQYAKLACKSTQFGTLQPPLSGDYRRKISILQTLSPAMERSIATSNMQKARAVVFLGPVFFITFDMIGRRTAPANA
jgi:hypothetical protein